jgi:hypothetical protein
MKRGMEQIVGKTIAHVIVRERGNTPQSQLFLLFTDGTYYEFYSTEGNIYATRGVERGNTEQVRAYMSSGSIVFEA